MEQHSAMRSTYQALSSTSSSSSSSALQQQQQHQQLLQQQQHHHQQQQQQQQQHSTSGDSQPFARRLSDGSLAHYAQSLTFTLNKLKRIFTQEQLYHQGKIDCCVIQRKSCHCLCLFSHCEVCRFLYRFQFLFLFFFLVTCFLGVCPPACHCLSFLPVNAFLPSSFLLHKIATLCLFVVYCPR